MCLILLSHKEHPKYKLILAANRDEFYNRPTEAAHWWKDIPNLLAGRDLQGGGTWLGISKSGRIAAITNYRKLPMNEKYGSTRGTLVTDWLNSDNSSSKYAKELHATKNKYDGYNLIFGSAEELYWYSNRALYSRQTVPNRTTALTPIEPGIHGLSNELLDSPWPKVEHGKEALSAIINAAEDVDPNQLFDMLHNTDLASDEELPDTGVGIEFERILSAAFIKSPEYGTRLSTVVLIDNDNRVYFEERSFIPESKNKFEFNIIAT